MKRRVLTTIILFLISINLMISTKVEASSSEYATLSNTQFYYYGYRVPYVLEYKDNYYINLNFLVETDHVSYISYDNYYQLAFENLNNKKWHNLQWKSIYKIGDKIGKVKKSKAVFYGGIYGETSGNGKKLLLIRQCNYINISDLSSDEFPLKYDKKSNSYYIGKLPKGKLKKDTIYEFLKKAIGKKDSDKIMLKKAHDYEAFKIKYGDKESKIEFDGDTTSSLSGALAVINTKIGQCGEYSKLYKEMCDRMMIPCKIVRGTSVKKNPPIWSGHAWNKVYVNNAWKYVDVTWDYSKKYKKISDVKHTYFLLSRRQMAKNHFNWQED